MIFNIFCPFLCLTTSTAQRNCSSLGVGLLERTFETKMVLNFFTAKLKLLILPLSVFFLFDLITNKARKLEVAESHHVMENFPISLSDPH